MVHALTVSAVACQVPRPDVSIPHNFYQCKVQHGLVINALIVQFYPVQFYHADTVYHANIY